MTDFNISKKAVEHADSCRFCWMCHHVCPVGNATGLERNTARARALAVSMVARGGVELTDDVVNNIYECTLCGGCTNVCVTGWDPILFTKETRNFAAMNGKLPSYIDKMLDNFEKTGNIYGATAMCDTLSGKIAAHSDKTDTLFYLGTDARCKCCKSAAKAIDVLDNSGLKFTVLSDEPDSGFDFDFIIGKAAETTDVMKKCADELNKFDTVVVYDPADAKIMSREYKEYGIELNCKVVTFTAMLASLVNDGKLTPKNTGKKLAYQDPALLARELGEVDEAREVISKAGELCDMLNCKKDTMFAGNLLMSEYMPDVMDEMARRRFVDVRNAGANAVVTASCSENAIMSRVCPDDIEVIAIEELF